MQHGDDPTEPCFGTGSPFGDAERSSEAPICGSARKRPASIHQVMQWTWSCYTIDFVIFRVHVWVRLKWSMMIKHDQTTALV